jgi:hypothetical protein
MTEQPPSQPSDATIPEDIDAIETVERFDNMCLVSKECVHDLIPFHSIIDAPDGDHTDRNHNTSAVVAQTGHLSDATDSATDDDSETETETGTDSDTNSNSDSQTHSESSVDYVSMSSALARFRRLLSDLVESHGVDELILRWTDCDRCQLEIIGRTIPTDRITDLIADIRYQTRLVALLTTRRQSGFQLDAGTINSIETTNCDGTEQSPDVCLNGDCDDVPSNEAHFSEPILNSSDVDPSMSPSPMATVATLSFDRDFIAPEAILLFGETNA